MKKKKISILIFLLFSLIVFMLPAKAENAAHKEGTLHQEHKQKVGSSRIRHGQRNKKKTLKDFTTWERQIDKEERRKQQEEKRLLLQRKDEEKLRERIGKQEQRLKLEEKKKLQKEQRKLEREEKNSQVQY